MSRGYFGVGVYHTKNELNIGTLWRTANLLGASFIFTIGKRYQEQASDTMKTPRHIPLYHYLTFDEFRANLPKDCRITAVELDPAAEFLRDYSHSDQAVYLLGAEDYGIPEHVLSRCHDIVKLPGDHSMNVAVAGSIVLYDRVTKSTSNANKGN